MRYIYTHLSAGHELKLARDQFLKVSAGIKSVDYKEALRDHTLIENTLRSWNVLSNPPADLKYDHTYSTSEYMPAAKARFS